MSVDRTESVPEKRPTRHVSRYETVIATLVGLCALFFCLYRLRATAASACSGVAHPRIRQRQRAHSLYSRQQRGRPGDYPACHCAGGWRAGEELEGGTRENIGPRRASWCGERHEWSCIGCG